MRIGLKSRLEKLEGHRFGQSPNRILYCKPESIQRGGVIGAIEVWQRGFFSGADRNPARGKLSEFSGKFVCIPEFESIEAFERMALKQQTESLAFVGDRREKRAEDKAGPMLEEWFSRK